MSWAETDEVLTYYIDRYGEAPMLMDVRSLREGHCKRAFKTDNNGKKLGCICGKHR